MKQYEFTAVTAKSDAIMGLSFPAVFGSLVLAAHTGAFYSRPALASLTRTDLLGGRHQLAHRQADPEETDEELHRPDRWDANRNPRRRRRPHEHRGHPLQAEGRKRQSSRKRAPQPSDRRLADLLHRQAQRIPQHNQPPPPTPSEQAPPSKSRTCSPWDEKSRRPCRRRNRGFESPPSSKGRSLSDSITAAALDQLIIPLKKIGLTP